ncbi:HEAT repeat domain-containing protein [Mesorhizobium sp. M0142]|uniref:HEAT repeat domain-containing protein n=1 Tax=unclassified Mesorhizobium TaxID=325217 RepID=UPI0033397FF0
MSELLENIAAVARKQGNAFLREFGTPIDLKIARCVDYSGLLRGEHQAPSTLDDLLEWAMRRGRIIISGRGASGKSALLHRGAILAAATGMAPFLISLSRWDGDATADWHNVRENAREALDFLLDRFSESDHDITDAEFLEPSVQKLFLLDGLNETPGSTADEILAACDQLASIMIGTAFILTDRLVRRNLNAEARWYFAMPLPVDKDEVNRLVAGLDIPAGAEGLLNSPFFLDRAIQGELRASPLATIAEMIESRGSLDPGGITAAAEAAFRAYEVDRSRTFDRDRFLEVGRQDLADTLLAGGILVEASGNRVAFFHHWYHDYLASKYVADRPELWNFQNRHHVLDTLTFRANSFDAIAFTLELLPAERIGSFLQAVYDWNPYAAGYALAEASVEFDEIPRDDRVVILAMLAERRFDRHFHSARRAADALALLGGPDAQRLKDAASLGELLEIVSAIDPTSEEFARWQRFFIAELSGVDPAELVGALADENSTIGWTAANVLKRLPLEGPHMEGIQAAASHDRAVVRWRAMHAMGAFTNDAFIAELLSRLDSDSDENVRYGAMRSLVEIASRDPAGLARVVPELIARLEMIESLPKVLGELSRAVFLSKGYAPPDWVQEISRVFYGLLERAEDPLDTERWSMLASRLRVHHRVEPKLAA